MYKDASKTTMKVGLEASFCVRIHRKVGFEKSQIDFSDSPIIFQNQ